MVNEIAAEFARSVKLSEIGAKTLARTLRAAAPERAALARRFGLVGLGRLEANVELRRLAAGGGIEVRGRLGADVVQTCVATLEAVPSTVSGEFALRFVRRPRDAGSEAGSEAANGREIDITPEVADTEYVDGDTIDIGEIVAQQMALSLPPYPRREAVEFGAGGAAVVAPSAASGPFAVLAGLLSGR